MYKRNNIGLFDKTVFFSPFVRLSDKQTKIDTW